MKIFDKPLFIFEMANNHQGKIEHGIKIIREINNICAEYKDYFNFAFKLQYRDLDSFIHPDYKNRFDIKNVKRFMDTRLTEEQFKLLKDEMIKNEMYTICTAFDENSVEKVKEHGYDVIKIASCSFTDWPLLEAISRINKPVIASTAGAEIDDIKRVVGFFKHRNIDISLMHCVAEYPTKIENLQLNQIDLLKKEFKVRVGYSTHESPDNFESIKIAIGKGAEIFEKHVGLPTETVKLNAYSANPDQVRQWLKSAYEALVMCGVKDERYKFTDKEKSDLFALRRGAFIKQNICRGEKIDGNNVYYAFPSKEGQLLSNNISKYTEFTLNMDSLDKDRAIMIDDVIENNKEAEVQDKVNKVINILKKAQVVIPLNSECELSHHYGIEKFEETGATIINCVNREYCKKIMVLLPGQNHPEHLHKLKEETFNILYGKLILNLDGVKKEYSPGESVVVERGVMHSFWSEEGCVFEEISTTHYKNDSYYKNKDINYNNNRKTTIYITKQLLDK